MKMEQPAQYLPFRINDTWYAAPMEYVSYIIASSEGFLKCSLPKSPPYIMWVMSIHNRLIPVIEWDMLHFAGTDPASIRQRPLILILNRQNSLLGLLTDEIAPPREFPSQDCGQAPVSSETILTHGADRYTLFDVPQFYLSVASGQPAADGHRNQNGLI